MKIDEMFEKTSKSAEKSDEDNELKYRCVNCGQQLKELTIVYSPTIQKLTECINLA